MNEFKSIKSTSDAKLIIFHYIERRLNEWAKWCKSGDKEKLTKGYPSASTVSHLMTMGHMVIEHSGPKPMPLHPAEEEIENIIGELAACYYSLAEVVRCHYLESGDICYKARKIGYSRTKFNETLANARWWLSGRLVPHDQVQAFIEELKRIQAREPKKM